MNVFTTGKNWRMVRVWAENKINYLAPKRTKRCIVRFNVSGKTLEGKPGGNF